MARATFARTLLAVTISCVAGYASADNFNRISSFPTTDNLPAEKKLEENSAEIITASEDGMTVIYTDSPMESLGFVNIANAKMPKPLGLLALGGEPTSVATAGSQVIVGINTSESYVKPSGKVVSVDIAGQKITAECAINGQPDSVAVSKDGKYAAIAIENERDEDLNDGVIPQLPAGSLAIVNLKNGMPVCDTVRYVDMTGLAEIAPSDPEPEFVDFNSKNEIVITLQENNHLAIVDAASGKVTSHFSAGSVDVKNVDIKKDGALTFNNELKGLLREPDAVKWLDDDRFVIANEGDYNGGARGFTIFDKTGKVLFESGASFEHEIAMIGHYPDKRSGKKGAEPEGLAVGKFGDQQYIFVMSERGSVIGVYKDTSGKPELVQLLGSGIAPESAVAIPSRGLLVSANEKDLLEDKAARAQVMTFQLQSGDAQYPQIKSGKKNGEIIGWGALSGLAADLKNANKLYAVNDSFYKNQPSIFSIDTSKKPAMINDVIRVTRDGKPAKKLDLEGIAVDPNGGFWLASEGKTKKQVPHAIYHVNSNGEIDKTLSFPEALLKHEKRFGAEGITLVGDTLWIAIQRQWKDDPENTVKLVSYNTESGEWGAVRYPTEPAAKGWVGLSEITAHGDSVYIIERDNQIGDQVKIKRLYKVALSELKPAKLGGELPVVKKEMVRDFIPDLKALNGYVVDKIEGFTVSADGTGYAVTDNDGVDDSSGETYFFSTGKM